MLADVTQKCRDVFGKDGFVIDQLTINGTLRLPQNVDGRASTARWRRRRRPSRARTASAQVEAEASRRSPQAHGRAEAARQQAAGRGRRAAHQGAPREAQANEIIRLSTTPAVLQYRALEHWDGKLPAVQRRRAVPMLTFDVSKAGVERRTTERQKRLEGAARRQRARTSRRRPADSAAPSRPAVRPLGRSRESADARRRHLRLRLTGRRERYRLGDCAGTAGFAPCG